ncbi:MAG: M3 family metallopeptidase [bacterium]|nr:M3 family metallopeptidase [bacterium]
MENKTAAGNPLLEAYNTTFNVPPFDKIKAEHFMPALEEGIKQQKAEIDVIVKNSEAPTFANTIEALDKSGLLLSEVSNTFSIYNAALISDAIRDIAKKSAPMISKHRDEIRLNNELFQRVKAVYLKKAELKLSEEQTMLLENRYKSFVRGGSDLPADKKERLKEINGKLSVMQQDFGNHILKETENFQLVLENKEDLEGLPQSVIDAASAAAEAKELKGKWLITINKPSLIPFLKYSAKRELREKAFKAYTNQCNNNNELDNKKLLLEIMTLRTEKAKMLGFNSYADYMLDNRMAKTPKKVYDLILQLWKPSLAMAKKEAKNLQAVIDKEGGKFKLQPWDWWYYATKLKKSKYAIDDEAMRPYFKLENVRDGAFAVANKLFGLKFVENKTLPKYHADVQVFEVRDADDSHLGILYMDFFPREGKRGGAWMEDFRKQWKNDGKNVYPLVTNSGNFTKPTADTPSLLSFDEASTLFHEFGHGLHGLLSNCNYRGISGTEVALDFVELPSQVLENWASEPEVLKMYAKHYKTGEVIPQELIDKMKKAGRFNQGFVTTELLSAALLDMDWHTLTNLENIDVDKFETESLNKIGLIPEIVVRYRSTYFRHVFASMYSAGYYSYTWAAVLDADAFQAFKETGLFDQKTAKAFRDNVLSKGGSAEAMELYKRFRGAEPKIDALLNRLGFNK